jgi:DNA-binding NtrC family response regulator
MTATVRRTRRNISRGLLFGVVGVAYAMRHVLVVEDELIIRMTAVDFLADAGFDVLEASSADEALRILHEKDSVFFLFTDVHMPGTLSGLELAHLVYKHWPHIKILIASGQLDHRSIKLPVGSYFLAKPYDHGKVVEHVRRHAG